MKIHKDEEEIRWFKPQSMLQNLKWVNCQGTFTVQCRWSCLLVVLP